MLFQIIIVIIAIKNIFKIIQKKNPNFELLHMNDMSGIATFIVTWYEALWMTVELPSSCQVRH